MQSLDNPVHLDCRDPNTPESETGNLYLPPDMVQVLNKRAHKFGMYFEDYIRQVFVPGLKHMAEEAAKVEMGKYRHMKEPDQVDMVDDYLHLSDGGVIEDIRLDKDVVQGLRLLAKEEGVTLTRYVELHVVPYLKEYSEKIIDKSRELYQAWEAGKLEYPQKSCTKCSTYEHLFQGTPGEVPDKLWRQAKKFKKSIIKWLGGVEKKMPEFSHDTQDANGDTARSFMECVGKRYRHHKRGEVYTVTSLIWDGSSNLWQVLHQLEGAPAGEYTVLFTRPLRNFFGKTKNGAKRFVEVKK